MDKPTLKEISQTGDILFVSGKGWISNLIRFISFGKATHVAIICGSGIYETDGAWRKSRLSPIDTYDQKEYELYRIDSLTPEQQIKIIAACNKRVGTPYAYLDCFNQALTFFLAKAIKDKITSTFSTSYFTKCDEETRIILAESLCPDLPNALCKVICENIGGGTPEEFRDALAYRKGVTRVFPA